MCFQQDYIRPPRQGHGESGILFVHALRDAAVPIVTVIGIACAFDRRRGGDEACS